MAKDNRVDRYSIKSKEYFNITMEDIIKQDLKSKNVKEHIKTDHWFYDFGQKLYLYSIIRDIEAIKLVLDSELGIDNVNKLLFGDVVTNQTGINISSDIEMSKLDDNPIISDEKLKDYRKFPNKFGNIVRGWQRGSRIELIQKLDKENGKSR